MNRLSKTLACLFIATMGTGTAFAKVLPTPPLANQTSTLSPILSGAALPFQVTIEKANFQLPMGFHSGIVGTYKGLWVFIAGRTNGLHGFDVTNNFPADSQNMSIYVVNPKTGEVSSRSLNGSGTGLTQKQIDTLTVTSPQFYQEDHTLYMTGGYGVDTATGTFGTKPVLTAFNLPGIVDWVLHPENKKNSVAKNIRQAYNSTFQITGGEMFKLGNKTQLVFGQNFDGQYVPGENGVYSNQVRVFQIKNKNGNFSADIYPSKPATPDANFRRRDLNILPVLLNKNNILEYGLVAYAGVFTASGGVWTVPVVIDATTNPRMADPNLDTTFKQGMNQYVCAAASFYSRKYTSTYHILFGGISYGFFSGGTFQTDPGIPFINQVTTIKMDKNNQFTQYIMDGEYPVIPSTGSNPGNPLLFGSGAYFMPTHLPQYSNTILSLDSIREPTVIGYIVGGIQSTLPNTGTTTDSSASPYVFKVTLTPTVTLATQGQSSTALSSHHAKQPLKQVGQETKHSEQTYNRKYREPSSPLPQ